MDITTEAIAAAMGKGRDDKCEGCGSRFIYITDRLSLEHCVTRVCELAWLKATATLTS